MSDSPPHFLASVMEALNDTLAPKVQDDLRRRLEKEFLPHALALAEKEGKNIAFAHFTAGLILRLLLRPVEAEFYFRRANQLQPGVLNTLQELVRCLGEQGRDPEALVYAREAVTAVPQHAEAWINLAVALSHCGKSAEARRAIDEAKARDPQNSHIRHLDENFDQYFNNSCQRISQRES